MFVEDIQHCWDQQRVFTDCFFMMTWEDLKELRAVTGDHQLTMWSALQVFIKVFDRSNNQVNNPKLLSNQLLLKKPTQHISIGDSVIG